MLHAAIDPDRFAADDRPARRDRERSTWGVAPDETGRPVRRDELPAQGAGPALAGARPRSARPAVPTRRRRRREVRPIRALAQRLGCADRVRFLGFRADPRDAYFAADFLVHPTFYDPCSLVALEALACGLPVVTTRYNGARRAARHHRTMASSSTTRTTPANSPAQSPTCSIRHASPARKAAAAEAGRRWTFEDHYRQLLAVFEEVAARKRAPPSPRDVLPISTST